MEEERGTVEDAFEVVGDHNELRGLMRRAQMEIERRKIQIGRHVEACIATRGVHVGAEKRVREEGGDGRPLQGDLE